MNQFFEFVGPTHGSPPVAGDLVGDVSEEMEMPIPPFARVFIEGREKHFTQK